MSQPTVSGPEKAAEPEAPGAGEARRAPEGRRIERTTSQTAEYLCVARACSFHDRSPYGHSDDWVAARLPNVVLRTASRLGPFRRLWRRLAAPGMYDWAVARTRYVDEAFGRLGPSMAQVVIMGAGYDSRAFRFADQLRGARIFEVDAPRPQADMRRGLELRRLAVPSNLVFVPVDFETRSTAECLAEAGFVRGKPTLYLLEGLIVYLEPGTVGETFRFISDSAGSGSVLVFDYAYADVVRGDARGRARFGAEPATKDTTRVGEKWRFGIEEGEVAAFLARYGFTLADEASPIELERRYFTDPSGGLHGRVNGTQAVVTARKP
jgi:methyltransferase (TIGR00027 family)